jgi:hypothetical protein
MESSRRQFLSSIAMAAGAAAGRAADITDPRVAGIVARTMGVDTHNHIDVPLTAAEMPGPDIDLAGEMKRSLGKGIDSFLYGLRNARSTTGRASRGRVRQLP